MAGCTVTNVHIRLSSTYWLLPVMVVIMTFAVDTDKNTFWPYEYELTQLGPVTHWHIGGRNMKLSPYGTLDLAELKQEKLSCVFLWTSIHIIILSAWMHFITLQVSVTIMLPVNFITVLQT